METKRSQCRPDRIQKRIGSSKSLLLNNYTPSAEPERYLVMERTSRGGLVRAWESIGLTEAALSIGVNDEQDSRFQIVNLDVEEASGRDGVLMPVMAVTHIIGDGTTWHSGQTITSEPTLDELQTTVESLVKLVADAGCEYRVTLTELDDHCVDLRLDIAKEHIGALIGRNGRIARSLRVVLNAMGGRMKKVISLDIREAPSTS